MRYATVLLAGALLGCSPEKPAPGPQGDQVPRIHYFEISPM